MKKYKIIMEVTGIVEVYADANNADEAVNIAWDSINLGDLIDEQAEVIDIIIDTKK